MNKENKISAILNIVANKEPESDILVFIESDNNDKEIKREVFKFPVIDRVGSRLEIDSRSEYYESTKANLLKIREELSK